MDASSLFIQDGETRALQILFDCMTLMGIVAMDVSKCSLVMKHRNTPSIRPNENHIAIEDERSLSQEFAKAVTSAEEWLVRRDWETVISNQDKLAAESWHACKDAV